MKVKVTYGDNVHRDSICVESSKTLRATLEDANFYDSSATVMLDGKSMSDDDLDCTFDDFGITEKCFLINVVPVTKGSVCVEERTGIIARILRAIRSVRLRRRYA